uniref:Uncharacterized protein n=1 Tax=Panagrellus redivivus TaxID=6233 RepID=A0A7E4W2P8_PANRE
MRGSPIVTTVLTEIVPTPPAIVHGNCIGSKCKHKTIRGCHADAPTFGLLHWIRKTQAIPTLSGFKVYEEVDRQASLSDSIQKCI